MNLRAWWSKTVTQAGRDRKRLDAALERLQAAENGQRIPALVALVGWVRPRRATDAEVAAARLQLLTEVLRENAAPRATLRDALLWLTAEKQPLRLLSDSGILANEDFVGGFWRRLSLSVLPAELDPAQLRDVVRMLFTRSDDYLWAEAIAEADWVALLDALDFGAVQVAGQDRRMPFQILEALQVISYRIASMGLEPELVRNHPSIERYESPFLTQNVELRQFIDERRAAINDKRAPELDDKHLLVLLGQCDEVVGKVRKQAAKSGASVSLTVLLARLSQNIARLKLLLQLLEDRPVHELNELRVRFFKQVVRAENRRNSIRELWSQTVDLLATRIVSNASKAGEQYITSGRSDYFHLFRSAMGAGLVVVAASLAKLWLYDPQRAPFGEAIVYSANYALAFVLMYVFHFSLATKQPAMTANSIAQAIETAGAAKRLDVLSDIVMRTFRSQFVAVLGNLIVVVPLAVYIAQVIWLRTGVHYLSPEKATHLLEDVNPLSPHVWIWAALTGVCLFATGLISGYYDNKAVYDRIPARVAQLRWLRKAFGQKVAERVATYVENNLGGLMGSLFFGLMLGSVGALGRVFGLPIDTLHVTFTSANSAYAIAALGDAMSWRSIATSIGGVTVIGFLNLLVSFGLALFVAMRSQRVSLRNTSGLWMAVLRRFFSRPQDFFWPPRTPPVVSEPEKADKKKNGAG
ncbi:RNA methyltransferase [Sinimarinibacterium sp. CAU 1509]|uniref:site-specific recombinase n=1 Tax=Sinimarinibacterium sp. CAU 1509 TaxID=2562283 RepID=UPI0010AD0E2D|nr:site-specific recombinase [Sinimarinibacterium sp. CAU 1509]TJY65041.1 RNA methyltransferase [Sinimarinibacterium sp. CAU 1509]